MVSKPTGRPVGRPRKPKRPRRPQAGRPPQTFRNDPDRYAVALLDAMLALELGSERACALGIAVWQVGIEATPRQIVSDRHVLTSWLRKPTRTGALAATLEGRALTLRSKQRRRCSGEDGAWRTAMASSFMLVLGACNLESVKSTILARANQSARANSPSASCCRCGWKNLLKPARPNFRAISHPRKTFVEALSCGHRRRSCGTVSLVEHQTCINSPTLTTTQTAPCRPSGVLAKLCVVVTTASMT